MKSPKAELCTKRSDFSPSGLLKSPLSEQWQNSLKKFPASKWRDFFQSNALRSVFVGLRRRAAQCIHIVRAVNVAISRETGGKIFAHRFMASSINPSVHSSGNLYAALASLLPCLRKFEKPLSRSRP